MRRKRDNGITCTKHNSLSYANRMYKTDSTISITKRYIKHLDSHRADPTTQKQIDEILQLPQNQWWILGTQSRR